MTASRQKVVQYLGEAHNHERALTRVLQSQIAMTPRGSYRTALETHLRETRGHAERIEGRLDELDAGSGMVSTLIAAGESLVGQALALSKTPIDLLRGSGGEEKVLKNAKDAAATEALEIATYTALERLAEDVGDDVTARLAASIRKEEERMLERIQRELPKLTDAVVEAEIEDRPSYDLTKTGAADAVRDAAHTAESAAKTTGSTARRTARQARAVPGVAKVEGQIKGAAASESDLAIARYDALTAEEIISRLSDLSQIDLAKIDAYERKNQNRSTVRNRISALSGNEPWPGYDELNAADVQSALGDADDERIQKVRAYERAHKNRAGVLKAADRERAGV